MRIINLPTESIHIKKYFDMRINNTNSATNGGRIEKKEDFYLWRKI